MTSLLLTKKTELLESHSVKKVLEIAFFSDLWSAIESSHDLLSQITFLSVLFIGQGSYVFQTKNSFGPILEALKEVELFYESLGGIIGYHQNALKLLQAAEKPLQKTLFRPPGFDLMTSVQETKKRALTGLKALPFTGFIFPIGGLGDRLNLKDETGQPLPAATLPFCGFSLLDGLVRDIQGLEFLYAKLFGRKIECPIALMTSFEKDNHHHTQRLCEESGWFGRKKENFLLFPQISVPVITEEGNWSMRSQEELNLHPGGHGALWCMAARSGVFEWFTKARVHSVLIRQINNPMCGIDNLLLSLLGTGVAENKSFGFACCKRHPEAAEGMLTLCKNEAEEWSISNIEYTEFKKQKVDPDLDLPANTNLLYIAIDKIVPKIKENPLPGLLLNMKSDVPFISEKGEKSTRRGGRLESMMQNLSDAFLENDPDKLQTFVVYNERKKTISVTKRSFEEGKPLLETPQGAYHDLMENGFFLLEKCGVHIDAPLHFLYHPALGPLYDVILQKICGGKISAYSELQLGISELYLKNLDLNGSLLISAKNLKTGSCVLQNVKIVNKGRKGGNDAWKNEMKHLETCRITLLGNSEFFAENVTFEGEMEIIVPDGVRLVAVQKQGELHFVEEPLAGWKWNYSLLDENILLEQHQESLYCPKVATAPNG